MYQTDESCPGIGKACKGKLEVDTISGDLYCNKCGYVSEERVAEPIRFTVEEELQSAPKRVAGKTTTIFGKLDANKGKISNRFNKMRSRLKQIGLWDDQIYKDNTDQRMVKNYGKFADVCNKLIPAPPKGLEDEPWIIYYKCLKKNLQKGRSAKSIMIGAICIFALKEKIQGFSWDGYAKKTSVDKKKILGSYALIRKELYLEEKLVYQDYYKEIKQIIGKINASHTFPTLEVTKRTIEIIDQVSKSGLTGGFTIKNQTAAAIFLACHTIDCPISISSISNYAKTSQIRIKNICIRFNSKLKLDIGF